MKMSLLAGMGLLMVCQSAFACDQGETLAFTCATTRGKVVTVCEASGSFGYAFGKPGATPELQLRVPRDKMVYFNSQGASGYMVSLGLPNGKTVYTVSHNWSASDGASGAIEVTVNDKLVATLDCKLDTLNDRLSELDLPSVE
jgi:hypothetical protein